jgi:hypothetical protein
MGPQRRELRHPRIDSLLLGAVLILDWKTAVVGYTGMIDVWARGEGRRTWKTGSWLGRSLPRRS